MNKNPFQPFIDRLHELANEQVDQRYEVGVETFLQAFRPVALRRISSGKQFLAQIEKLLAARNATRAAKLLSATKPAILPRFVKVLFLPALFIAVAAVITVFGVQQVREARESETWPSTKGWILQSEVTVSTSTSSSAGNRYGGGTTTTTHAPSIRYEYTVKGKLYSSSRIAFNSHSGKEEAQRTVDRFPQGAAVEVFYNPSDPAQATLETGLDSNFYFIFGLAGFFALSALIATCPLWWGILRRTQSRQSHHQ